MRSPSRFRSLALLVAALAHLLSIPAEPVVHGWLHAPAIAAGATAEGADHGGAGLHQEAFCVVCQGINEHALPQPAAAPVLTAVRQPAPRRVGESRPTSVSFTRVQARAPPI